MDLFELENRYGLCCSFARFVNGVDFFDDRIIVTIVCLYEFSVLRFDILYSFFEITSILIIIV